MAAQSYVRPMSWGMILLIMVVIALGTGLVLSGLRKLLGLSGGFATTGVGAAVGVASAILITRRRAALAAQEKQRKR